MAAVEMFFSVTVEPSPVGSAPKRPAISINNVRPSGEVRNSREPTSSVNVRAREMLSCPANIASLIQGSAVLANAS